MEYPQKKHIKRHLNHKERKTVVVAADTGVDYKHEDLKSVMWINKKEVPNNVLMTITMAILMIYTELPDDR